MSWKLTKTVQFEASHQLVEHDGKCARLHGHSWRAHVTVKGSTLNMKGPQRGMLIDYGELGKTLAWVHSVLDHSHLNDHQSILGYPTSENVAHWIYHAVEARLPTNVMMDSVVVEETCGARCEYKSETDRAKWDELLRQADEVKARKQPEEL